MDRIIVENNNEKKYLEVVSVSTKGSQVVGIITLQRENR